jgi:hypothetical protein
MPPPNADHFAAVAAARARVLAALPYERVSTTGAEAFDEWTRLKAAGRGWPVIVGGDDQLERIAEHFSIADPSVMGFALDGLPLRSPSDILDIAASQTFPADLTAWLATFGGLDPPPPDGDWPSGPPPGEVGLSVVYEMLTRQLLDRAHILLPPAEHNHEIPAFLRWGGWNACPPPEIHVAALRSWGERFGAELVGVNGDTMNIQVSRRPADREEALSLAREHYRYCPDIVDQGVGSIAALAAMLLDSDWWFFWWD